MTTEKLYYENCRLAVFTARVLACREREGGFAVLLDRTAFYPGGGGQACDTGTLGSSRVTGMAEENEEILHLCDRPLTPGESVEGRIDWLPRFIRMQQHTGEHILSGLVHRKYGYHNTGFHMNLERIQVDFDGPIPVDALPELESAVNDAVWQNLPVKCCVPGPEELGNLSYRTKRKLSWPVRIVEVPGFDMCACCGVHVAFTGEAGPVKLWSAVPFRGGTRLEMSCGIPALNHLNAVYQQAKEVSRLLSAPVTGIGEATGEIYDQLGKAKYRSRQLELDAIRAGAEKNRGRGDLLLFRETLEPELMVFLADCTAESCGGTAAVFVGAGGTWRWCVIDKTKDLRPLVKTMHETLHARGGGKPGFQQGSAQGEKGAIAAFFRERGFGEADGC